MTMWVGVGGRGDRTTSRRGTTIKCVVMPSDNGVCDKGVWCAIRVLEQSGVVFTYVCGMS